MALGLFLLRSKWKIVFLYYLTKKPLLYGYFQGSARVYFWYTFHKLFIYFCFIFLQCSKSLQSKYMFRSPSEKTRFLNFSDCKKSALFSLACLGVRFKILEKSACSISFSSSLIFRFIFLAPERKRAREYFSPCPLVFLKSVFHLKVCVYSFKCSVCDYFSWFIN